MKLLLDTNVLRWAAAEPDNISEPTRDLFVDGANEVYVSVIGAWEIAIKQSIGKLDLPKPAEVWKPDVIRRRASKSQSSISQLPWVFAGCPGTTEIRSIGF